MTTDILDRRRAGVLLHPTSLPGAPGNGDLGPDADRFIAFLAQAGITVWQSLPLGPTHGDRSPYHCLSVHAGNPLLISLTRLKQWGWLDDDALGAHENVDVARRAALLRAHAGFARTAPSAEHHALQAFIESHAGWLDDFSLYEALRQSHGSAPWWRWPAEERDREPGALARARERLRETIAQVRFEQFVFFRQWLELKSLANHEGILLFGDMPIFVARDSAEVWAHREYFALDDNGEPLVVAGVPPDYFSETGQRWGNPLYNWERMRADGFRWWLERMRTQLELFDLTRIDHFRGFEAYWEIPATEETAVNGRWVEAPGDALFTALQKEFHPLPLVAEDLGLITPQVHALRERYRLPGMRVLQFAFGGGPTNPYLPHNHLPDTVVYTGTHDNDTTLAWFEAQSAETQRYVRDYLGYPGEAMPWPLLRAALASVARLAIFPLQDVLSLGAGERMNIPGTATGNWRWRFGWEQVQPEIAARLRHLIVQYGRDGRGPA